MVNEIFQDEELMELAKSASRSTQVTYTLPFDQTYVARSIYFYCSKRAFDRGGKYKINEELSDYMLRAARWLTDPEDNPWMMFMGLYGNGKTALALGVFQAYYHLSYKAAPTKRKRICFMTSKKICDYFLRERDFFDGLVMSDFLVIDDFGDEPVEVVSYGMTHTPIIDLLAERYERRLPTLLTTNLSGEEFEARYGARIADRLRELTTTLVFRQPSFRTPSMT